MKLSKKFLTFVSLCGFLSTSCLGMKTLASYHLQYSKKTNRLYGKHYSACHKKSYKNKKSPLKTFNTHNKIKHQDINKFSQPSKNTPITTLKLCQSTTKNPKNIKFSSKTYSSRSVKF